MTRSTGRRADGSAPTRREPARREPTRREQQRAATHAEVLRVGVALVRDGEDLSLRAVAARMGVTAPALYRYVASAQDLVDLVAVELDRQATATFREAVAAYPTDDPGARLAAAVVAFRRWALGSPREFSLVFANPVVDASCTRRELLEVSHSGPFMTDLLREVWERTGFAVPTLAELDALDPRVREAVVDPLIPAEVTGLADDERGLLWVSMQAWAALYGVVALEVFGHLDPRVREAAAMFRATMLAWVPRLGLDADALEPVLRTELARST